MWFAPLQEFLLSYRRTLGLNVMPFLKFSWQKHRFPKQQRNITQTLLTKHCCPLTAFSKGHSPTDSSLQALRHVSMEEYKATQAVSNTTDPLSATRLVWFYTSVRVQRMNHTSWLLVEEFLLPCPFVYYIFNTYYLCCLVALKPSNAVFKNTFTALPMQSLLKKKQSRKQRLATQSWMLAVSNTMQNSLSCSSLPKPLAAVSPM